MNNARSLGLAQGICRGLWPDSTGRNQLILFIFRRDSTTCQVHMPYVVPDVMGQPCPCAVA
jgi:hypothetical protein